MNEVMYSKSMHHFTQVLPIMKKYSMKERKNLFFIEKWDILEEKNNECIIQPVGNILRLHLFFHPNISKSTDTDIDTHTLAYNYDDVDVDGYDLSMLEDITSNRIDDGLSTKRICPSNKIIGHMDIIIHPAYQVPCPFIQLWYDNGSYLTTEEIQRLVDQYNDNNNHHQQHQQQQQNDNILLEQSDTSRIESNEMAKHVIFPFGRLISEEHPYTGKISTTMHVCELNNYLKPVLLQTSNDRDIVLSNLYLLSWFSLIGPYFGLAISPIEYIECSKILT